MSRPFPMQLRRVLAAILSVLIAVGPAAGPAYGAATVIADEPIGFTPAAEPNIVLTVDDSTSMIADYLPDYAIGSYCRHTDGTMNTACGFGGNVSVGPHAYSQSNVPFNAYLTGYGSMGPPTYNVYWPAPIHNSALNRLYYDPRIAYTPAVRYDKSSYPNATFTSAPTDPWRTPVPINVNLNNTVTAPLYCNTDWPPNLTWDPANAGGGEYCRVNGSDYTGKPWSPIHGDYTYPWVKNSAALSRPLVAADEKFYFQTGFYKTNYCNRQNFGVFDTANPPTGAAASQLWYPQQCTATAYTCTVGVYTPPPAQAQYCKYNNDTKVCDTTKDTDYSPVGCQRSPLYSSPGLCPGGPECLPCSCSNPSKVTGKQGYCRLVSSGSGGSGASCTCSGAGCTLPAPGVAPCTDYTAPGPGTCTLGGTVVATRFNCVAVGGNPTCSAREFLPSAFTNYAVNASGVATSANNGPTIQADSDANGDVCRHNMQNYAGVAANRRNYPAGIYTTAVNQNASCTLVSTANVPRHYYKTSVEWCSSRVTTADDRWRGYGLAGTCQNERDAAHPYPRFYKWGVPNGRKIYPWDPAPQPDDPAHVDNYTYPAFERVDLNSGLTNCSAQSRLLDAANYCVHRYWKNGAWQTITNSFATESQNYANWFSYYRTRILVAKTIMSQNFKDLDIKYRMAFHTLSNVPATSFIDFAPFASGAGGQKDRWYTQLFGVGIAMGKNTPIIDAMVRIGEDFKNGGNPSLGGSGSADPIVLTCQKNYHMLFTDGQVQQATANPLLVGNLDSGVSATMPYAIRKMPEDQIPALAPLTIAPGDAAWPPLYHEKAPGISNSLADYAMYYWITDLRPGMNDDVPNAGNDPASWQHLNFAALSFGTESILPTYSVRATQRAIASGTTFWPIPSPNTYWPTNGAGVDDLWHAAVNARGAFVNAKTPTELGRGVMEMIADINSAQGTAVGASFAGATLSATNNHVYMAGFVPKWGGWVRKLPIDPATGVVNTAAPVWDASSQLTAQTTPSVPFPDPWNTQRRIVTVNDTGTAAYGFTMAKLSGSQAASLGANATAQTAVLEFLRGAPTNEGSDEGQLRIRAGPLGDIVNSQPTYVGAPAWPFLDPGYSAFKASNAGRPARIYVGGNDGMLHAFDEATGAESWAFVPRDFFRTGSDGLVGLSYQVGGYPNKFEHRYFVDSTPRVVDADLTNDGNGWRTLLVSGLGLGGVSTANPQGGRGGRSYFALDVTDPATMTDEDKVASRFLWEFRDPDLGFTVGKPIIVKTRAHGWVVVVSTGYNNASGVGKLFFLRASTGAVLRTMCTGNDLGDGCGNPEGTPANPAGLAHFAGYVKDYRDQTVEQIYAGDLLGNAWRFDVSDVDPSKWRTEKLAKLAIGGTPQPITTPPQIEVDVMNGVDRWVFFGTGKLLDPVDLTDTSTQSFYAIRDGTGEKPWPITATLTRGDLDPVSGIAGLGANVIAAKGWYDDITGPPAGGRIISPLQASVGLVGYVASFPSTDKCDVGLPAQIYVRFFGNGGSALTDDLGTSIEYFDEPEGAVGIDIVALQTACGAKCLPELRLMGTTQKGNVRKVKVKLPPIAGQHRINFRGLGQ